MRYYLGLDLDADIESQIAEAKRAEDAVFDAIWSTHYYNSPFVPLAAIAGHTERIGLGSNIAYAFTRSPMETALTSLDLDSTTHGRFTLGLAPGFKTINERWYGVPHGRPAPHVKECIEVTRAILEKACAGEPVRYKGGYYDIDIQGWHRAQKRVREQIPIYVGAMQQGMCRMAGDVADGLIPHTICTPRWMREVMVPNIAIGLKRSRRERKEFDLCAAVSVAISRDRKQALHDYRDTIAFSAVTKTYQPIFAWHGYEKEVARIRELFLQRGYGPEVIDSVTDEMVEAFTFIGTADEVRRRVEELDGLADSIFLAQTGYGLPKENRKVYRDAIYETFGR